MMKYIFIGLIFLPTASHAWVIDSTFDVGNEGNKVTEFSDAAGNTVYEKKTVHSGGGSAKLTIKQGEDGWGTWGGRKVFPTELGEGDEIWIKLRTFFPEGFNFNTNLAHLKFLRLTVKEANGSHIGNHDLMILKDLSYLHYNELGNTAVRMEVFKEEYAYAQNLLVGETIVGKNSGASARVTGLKPSGFNFKYATGSPSFSQYEALTGELSGENRIRMRYIRSHNNTRFGSAYPIRTNVWETIVLRMRFSATNPLLQFYKLIGESGFSEDGKPIGGSLQLIYQDVIDKTLKTSTDKVWAFLIFTYWNGNAPKTQSMYIDDLQISTEPPAELKTPKPPSSINVDW